MDELGRVISNACQVVPAGVVIFFPSYDYERQVHAHWQTTGVIDRISTRKKIFREPKLSRQVDGVLAEYAATIQVRYTNCNILSREKQRNITMYEDNTGVNQF